MTAPSGQLEAGEVAAERLMKARELAAVIGQGDVDSSVAIIARAFAEREAAAERRGAERERERARLERCCIWDPYTTGRLNVLCKTCRRPKNQGPFIHVEEDSPEAAAIRARGK